MERMVEITTELRHALDSQCTWEADAIEAIWITHCGEHFIFNDDGPTANGFKFCPYCGKPLIKVKSAD